MSRSANIEQRAAEWLVRRDEATWSPVDQEALENWLDSSMANRAAYWRLEHGWREADRIGSLGRPSVPTEMSAVRRPRWLPRALAASIALTCGVGFLAWTGPWVHTATPLVAETRVGQRGEMSLSDGSRVELNTATRARAALERKRREVWLERGEAYFEVAHDRSRPFVVHAGPTTITVLGTKFGVRREGDRVTVAVIEGRVQLTPATIDAASRATVISAGDTALTRDGALMLAPRSAERVDGELAWRYGILRFQQEPLSSVVAEFNRYNERKIVISDDGVGAIRVGGSFHARNSEAFLRLLKAAYGLRIDRDGEKVTISN